MIAYRAMLDVPEGLVRYLARLLAAERRRRGTPAGSRKLTPRAQAVLALRWFRDRTRVEAHGRDHGGADVVHVAGGAGRGRAERSCR